NELLLPLDAICILTLIPKWMPTVSRWPDFFKTVSEGGYNMVHLAPVSTRGASNSPYSIYDQLSLSPDLFDSRHMTEAQREAALKQMLGFVHEEYGILSVTDVVWNHTAHNSAWLQYHPEAGYNMKTSPHLRPAYELDEALLQMSEDMEKVGLTAAITTEADLIAAMGYFKSVVVPRLKLWEFYVIDVKKVEKQFREALSARAPKLDYPQFATAGGLNLRERALLLQKVALGPAVLGERFGKNLDINVVMAFMMALKDQRAIVANNDDDLVKELIGIVDEINLDFYKESDSDIAAIVENVASRAKYLRVDDHGPKLGPVSRSDPFVDTYFTRLPENEITKGLHAEELALANNGWIWNADPLLNFASPQSKAYLRREVIAWGDCVKLRYGNGPKDNPWLWEHQRAYTEKMARLFHGFRIDNCHSTPIHVAAYLLDAARLINPNLYVFAELFTGSEDKDLTFVKQLGINSLIREAMNAWDPHELSRLVHRHGGVPVGSLTIPPEYFPLDMLGHPLDSSFYSPVRKDETIVVNVCGSSPHALFMDCTHDNETPHQKRTAEDTLSTAALVAMSHCAVGSVKGYDEVVPYLLNVVTETRKYRLPDSYEGIIPAKSILMNLHTKMAREGYTEIHVHQENDYISVHRVHPITHDGYLLIARCAFWKTSDLIAHSPIVLLNQSVHVIESAGLRVQAPQTESQRSAHPDDHRESRKTLGAITGLPCFLDFSAMLTTLANAEQVYSDGQMKTVITVDPKHFLPGSIVVYRTWMNGSGLDLDNSGALLFDDNVDLLPPGLNDAIKLLRSEDVNVILYRSGPEEQDIIGEGLYDVPGFGSLVYCGLQGFLSAFLPIARTNNLGHPICANIRLGPWMLDYVTGRLEKYSALFPRIKPLKNWLEERFYLIKRLPSSFVPKYFFQSIYVVYQAIRALCIGRTAAAASRLLKSRSHLLKESSLSILTESMVMTKYQLVGRTASTGLYPPEASAEKRSLSSFAAGLPHFATRHMRCWGRDIFISLRGLLLLTGDLETAKNHILAFGANVKHGLIPNLLDQGIRPRYNARDAAWWWLWSVQQYCKSAPEGLAFLNEKVPRRFPPIKRYWPDSSFLQRSGDDLETGDNYVEPSDPAAYQTVSTVAQICHEILERHARGIRFREWNAGPALDHAMSEAGFDIACWTGLFEANGLPDTALRGTGIVGGGNRFNCGTWMDKMGDSEKAGTKGLPATPRDGADVEIVGLVKAALRWVNEILESDQAQVWPWPAVVVRGDDGKDTTWTYKSWNDSLQKSFEKFFYIPSDPAQDGSYFFRDVKLINKRGIYKDTVGSSLSYADLQLRPNFCVAMVVAPELFDAEHARGALEVVKKHLHGPLGMRTLDPSDWAYRGVYDNANDSDDPSVAHGYNYHQGPEWLWLTGFFLRAYLHFNLDAAGARPEKRDHVVHWVQESLLQFKTQLANVEKNPFVGLPELTNKDGEECHHSCPTQAWSAAALVEVVRDLVHEACKP
ncbi:glucanotransferase domain of glycogen debranching enzyme-domain-containing protein, partial [Zopfochytrium polystomum]